MGARAALPVNPHVADGFLTENPTSSQPRSNLNLVKPIILMGWFFPLPRWWLACGKVPRKGWLGGESSPQLKRDRAQHSHPEVTSMSQHGARSPGTGEVPGAAAGCADQSEIQAATKSEKGQERSYTPAQSQFAAGRERKPNSSSPKPPPSAELSTPPCARHLKTLDSTIPPTAHCWDGRNPLLLVPRASGQA